MSDAALPDPDPDPDPNPDPDPDPDPNPNPNPNPRIVRPETAADGRDPAVSGRTKRLGRPFWLVWWASTVSGLGDGIRYVAFPLIAASLTHNPNGVALVAAAGYLPWPVFGLLGGAVVDRTDRRRLMWRTDSLRAVLVGLFAVVVAVSPPPVAVLAVVSFLLGVAETFFDNAASAIVPMLVDESVIERANSWLLSTQTVMSIMLGAPIGGALFAIAHVVPIAVDAVSFAVAAALVAAVAGAYSARKAGPQSSIASDIGEGLRWLAGHRVLRTLCLELAVMNATSAAAEAVLVLYSLEILHIGTVGYGLLLSVLAIGGVAGTVVAPALLKHLGLRTVVVGAGSIQAGMLLVAGLTSSTVLVVIGLALTGAASMIWNVTTVSLRQRVVPAELLGRVTSSYRVIGLGAMPVGALTAGGIASAYGLHAPYLIGGILMAVATVVAVPFLKPS